MSEPASTSILIPSGLSPADAEAVRSKTLEMLNGARDGSNPVAIDFDGDTLSPCALQILVAATRTAEHAGVSYEVSDQGNAVLSALQQH